MHLQSPMGILKSLLIESNTLHLWASQFLRAPVLLSLVEVAKRPKRKHILLHNSSFSGHHVQRNALASMTSSTSCNIVKAFAERVCASPCCNELNVATNAPFSCSFSCFLTLSFFASESEELESNLRLAFFVFNLQSSSSSSLSSPSSQWSPTMSRSCPCAPPSLASRLPKSLHRRAHPTPIPAHS